MAKKAASESSDRADPRKNKSLAIRNVLKKMPTAKASEVVEAVHKEYGQQVAQNMVYMVKTKGTMRSNRRTSNGKSGRKNSPMNTAARWVEAIKIARHLLKVTGSAENATALLNAVEG